MKIKVLALAMIVGLGVLVVGCSKPADDAGAATTTAATAGAATAGAATAGAATAGAATAGAATAGTAGTTS